MPTLTVEILHKIMPNSTFANNTKYLPFLDSAMSEFNINSTPRIAAFLAQIAHESGSLHYVEEIASGAAYEKRSDLGNLRKEALAAAHAKGSTTGRFYKGRGLIQITGYDNYLKCGKALSLDLVDNPQLLVNPENACRSAAWFFDTHGLNGLADLGEFKQITRKINGGYNGLKERELFYAAAQSALA
jgi:putative chitinase